MNSSNPFDMSGEIEDLMKKLEPVIGRGEYSKYVRLYRLGKFNPTLKKLVEHSIKHLATQYLENQVVLYPFPSSSVLMGDYPLGQCHYGVINKVLRFGLRDRDFIKHVGVFGATGAGKTSTVVRIIRHLCESGKPFLILDPKGTWQAIIRKDWAKHVKVLRLGSSYAPLTFNPFLPLPGMDLDTMIAEVVEVFCASQYLGHGAKNLLLRAIEAARRKDHLSLKAVYEEFMALKLKGHKMESWATSTERALWNASTGILGRVLNSPDNIPFEKLMKSQVIILMDGLADDAQKAMFNGLMLNRIYWHRKLAGIKEQFRHLLVMEEFHVMSSAEKFQGESRIDFLIKMCREFSQGVMILEQNPGSISQHVLGNLNTVMCLNLGHTKDINSVGTAMVLDADARKFLGKLPTGWAICRVKDRFPETVLVRVDHEPLDKSELTLEEIKAQNGDFISQAPEGQRLVETIRSEALSPLAAGKKLGTIHRKMLRVIAASGKVPNLKEIYLSMGLNYRQGRRARNRLLELGLIEMDERVPTASGVETKVYLTDKGRTILAETEEARRLGGDWHRSTVQKVAGHYERLGFFVRKEWRNIDLLVDKGDERVAVEVESLISCRANDLTQAVSNIMNGLRHADRVQVIVRDRRSARKLKEALEESPVPKHAPVKIRFL